MIRKFVLDFYRWLSLRKFPCGAPQGSYMYYLSYSPMIDAKDEIMLYEKDCGVTMLCNSNAGMFPNISSRMDMGEAARCKLYDWLKSRFTSKYYFTYVSLKKDPVLFRLFAYDNRSKWSVSINVHELSQHKDLIDFRKDFSELINSLLSSD